MTDEIKKLSDDEYQFPADEYVTVDQYTSHGEEEPMQAEGAITEEVEPSQTFVGRIRAFIKRYPLLQNKRIVFTVLIAVVALILFKIISPSHKKVTQQKPVQEAVQQRPSPAVMGQLANLQHAEVTSQNDITQLQQQIQGMRDALNQASASQVQLNHTLNALVDQMKVLSTEMQVQPNRKVGPAQPQIVYHLQAVVPGRAWIINNFGQSETISVGDPVTQYGTVKAIDANRGEVLTSSGKAITYGLYDS